MKLTTTRECIIQQRVNSLLNHRKNIKYIFPMVFWQILFLSHAKIDIDIARVNYNPVYNVI